MPHFDYWYITGYGSREIQRITEHSSGSALSEAWQNWKSVQRRVHFPFVGPWHKPSNPLEKLGTISYGEWP